MLKFNPAIIVEILKRREKMAEVKMDLQELKAIENKIKEVQEKAESDKKELQDKYGE